MELADWVDAEGLSDWVADATERLIGTVSDFDNDDPRWMGPYAEIVNPPIWELAHVAWFAEWFVLRQLHGLPPLLDHVDERYDSGRVGHRTRWQLTYPTPDATIDYVRRVGDQLIEVVGDDQGLDSTAAYVAYAITHYDAHYEALTYTRQTLDWGGGAWPTKADGADRSGSGTGGPETDRPGTGRSETDRPGTPSGDRAVPGGRYVLGGSRCQPFVMDNEKWGHRVDLAPYSMAVVPVTVADYLAFVDDGGYQTDTLWSPEGLAWRHAAGAQAPAYWRRGADGWERRVGAQWRPVGLDATDADHPMIHVCWWEATAYCRWAQRRLPTEAEWEVAATTGPDGSRRPWFPWIDPEPGRPPDRPTAQAPSRQRDPSPDRAALDARTGGTVPVGAFGGGDGPWGHRQLLGNVWEWTASTFLPYPHFEPDAYRDNSEPWFGTRKVLRGGSWVTRSRYVRSTFRNYFEPHRRDVLAGFRTCAR